MKNLEQLKKDFIDYIDASKETKASYENGIDSFIKYLNDNGIFEPKRKDVIAFRDMLRDNYSANTVNSYMVALRNLYKFIERQGLGEDITVDVKGANTSTMPKTQVLQQDEASKIYSKLTDKREKALFSLLITTGLRGVEVANARIEDIKIHNDEIVLWVQCKNHSERDEYVKISDAVFSDIYEYLNGRTTGYIFVGSGNKNNGGKLTTKTIRFIVKAIFKRFGYDFDHFSTHTLRRSCATISYNLGADMKELQLLLHHQNIQTTFRYVSASTRNNSKAEYNLSNAILNN
jgi:site-specific recombinase XerD